MGLCFDTKQRHWQGCVREKGFVVVVVVIVAGGVVRVPKRAGVEAQGGPGRPGARWKRFELYYRQNCTRSSGIANGELAVGWNEFLNNLLLMLLSFE